MKPSIKKLTSGKTMRVATTFTGVAACATALAPTATAGTGQPAVTHPGHLRTYVTPDTETGCTSHFCIGLYGGGSHVSYVNGHWFNGTGCHLGHIVWYSPGKSNRLVPPEGSYNPNAYYCSKAEITKVFNQNFAPGTLFCVWFNNIGNQALSDMCEPVR